MLMLDRAEPVAVRELSKIPCPAPTESWRPYPHSEVVAALSDRMQARGLKVRNSRLTLVDGALYPERGVRVDVKGARLFGSFDMEPTGEFVPGAVPSLGLRNSTDQRYSLTVLIGMGLKPTLGRILTALYKPEPVWTHRLELDVGILSMGNPRVRRMAEAVPA